MAEEAVVEDGAEQKPKSKLIPLIAGAVGLIVLVAGTMLATLYFTGYFKPKAPTLTADERIALGLDPEPNAAGKGGAGGKDAKDGKDGKPEKLKKSPQAERFDFNYFKMENEFLVNVTGSKKVMSIQVAVMTRYDQKVIDNLKKHEFALRSVMMDVMRQSQDAEINKPEFRVDLAKKLRDAMNALLEKFEEFGGVEEVFFTSFIVQ
ncbi:MAG: flagellar basal body-associated FliL family protein [Betaproteobacteria bacterium]